MKKLTEPQSGKCGNVVAFKSRYGQVERAHTTTDKPFTQAQLDAQAEFGTASSLWEALTEEQRRAWDNFGKKVRSHPRGGQCGPLAGQVLFTAITRNQLLVGLLPFQYPPQRPSFDGNPVSALHITRHRGKPVLKVTLSGPTPGHILIYASHPHNAGRRYCDKFLLLDTLPPSKNGEINITKKYLKRHLEPWPGSRVFLRIIQQVDGWRGFTWSISAIFDAKSGPAARLKVRWADSAAR